MTTTPTAPRIILPIFAVLAGLACLQGACSLGSLEYLKNGHKQDGAVRDGIATEVAIPDSSSLDARSSDGVNLDALPSGGDSASDRSGGKDAGERMPDGAAGGDETSSGAADTMALDGDNDVVISWTADAVVETGGSSVDETGGTGSMDAPPAIDSADVDGANWEVADLDGPPADSAAPDSAIPDSPLARPSVLLVVGVIPLGTNDAAIQTRLVGKGYDVTLIADANLAGVTSFTATVVVISRTVTAANVTKLRTITRPLMVCKPPVFADMGFVDGSFLSEGSTLLDYSTLVVSSTVGELGAGLSGTVTVLQAAASLSYGLPNSQALTVASIPGSSNFSSIFAYDTGAQMYNLAAPARRVGFSLGQNDAASFTANGWLLFDAALAWLAK